MKRFFMLAFLLVACGAFPLRLGIDDINVTIPLAVNTNGSVIYQKNPSVFNQPAIQFSGVKLEGNASATPITNEVRMFLYGRTTDPALDAKCTNTGTLYFCPSASEKKINSSEIVLSSSGAKRAFTFDDSNNVLRDGINGGKIWTGIEVTAGAAVGVNLKLTDLLSIVTLL